MNVKSRRLSAASEAIRTLHGTHLMLNSCKLEKEQQFRSLALEEKSFNTNKSKFFKQTRESVSYLDFAQAKIFFSPADSCINSAKNLAYYEQY